MGMGLSRCGFSLTQELWKEAFGRAKLIIKGGAGGRCSKKSAGSRKQEAGGRKQEARSRGQKADLYARLATVDDSAARQCAELWHASAPHSVRTIHEVTQKLPKKSSFSLV